MHTRHVSFSEEPVPVSFYDFKDSTQVTVNINITEVVEEPVSEEEEPRTHWEADQYIFWELTSVLDKEAVEANPEGYMEFAPSAYKQEAKDKAQAHLDHIRATVHVVPVPSYKEGYAVMHREKDDINLLAGLIVGGLPYFEFADGQVVSPLTAEALQLIYTDVAAHEVKIQQDKQACWSAIDAAVTLDEVDIALNNYIS